MPRQNGLFSSLKDSITSGLSAFANAARNKTMEPSRNLLAQRAQTIPTSVYRSEPTKAPTMMSSLPNAVRSVAEQALQKPVSEMLQTGRERFKELEKQGPTPTRPGVPVNARGAGMSFPSTVTQPEAQPAPMTPAGPTPELRQSRFTAPGMQPAVLPQMTPDQYLSLTSQQKQAYDQAAFQQRVQREIGQLGESYRPTEQAFERREEGIEQKISEAETRLAQETQAKVDVFRQEAEQSKQTAIKNLQRTASRRKASIAEGMSFAGFGRSTKKVEMEQQIDEELQAQIASIESQTGRSISQYQESLLAKNEAKIAGLQDKLERTQDQRFSLELDKAREQRSLVSKLFAADPTRPENMAKAAEALQKTRLEEAKLAQKEREELRGHAFKTFEYMTDTFGSQWTQGLSDEAVANMAYNMNMPASVLRRMGSTMAEQKLEFDAMKFAYDAQTKDRYRREDQDFRLYELAQKQAIDLQKIELQHQNQLNTLQFKNKLDVQKEVDSMAGLGYGEYANNALASTGSSLQYSSPVPHPLAKTDVIDVNPKLTNFYPEGYRFKAAHKNDLTGQCAWFAQQCTDLRKVGNTIGQKLNSLGQEIKKGKAFKPGEETIRPGHSILTNESKKWGHVAVVNAVTPDGKIVLTEANYAAPLKVTHTRVLDANDPRILGVFKSKPKAKWQTGKQVGNALSAVPDLMKGNWGDATIKLLQAGAPMLGDFLSGRPDPKAQEAQQAVVDNYKKEGLISEDNQPMDQVRLSIRQGLMTDSEISKKREKMSRAVQLGVLNPMALQAFESDVAYGRQYGQQRIDQDLKQVNQLASRYKGLNDEVRQLEQGISVVKNFDINHQNSFQDQALIFSFMKVLDPGSVVREGEFNTARNNQGYLSRFGVTYDSLQGKGMLSSSGRQAIIDEMNRLYASKRSSYDGELRQAQQVGQTFGIDPGLYLSFSPTASPTTAGGYSMPDANTGATSQSFYSADDF